MTLAAAVAARVDVAKRAVVSPPYRPPTGNSWTTWWPPCVLLSLTLSVASSPTSWSSPVWLTLTWLCISSLVTVYLKAFVSVAKVSPTEWCILISSYGENPFFQLIKLRLRMKKSMARENKWIFHISERSPSENVSYIIYMSVKNNNLKFLLLHYRRSIWKIL